MLSCRHAATALTALLHVVLCRNFYMGPSEFYTGQVRVGPGVATPLSTCTIIIHIPMLVSFVLVYYTLLYNFLGLEKIAIIIIIILILFMKLS